MTAKGAVRRAELVEAAATLLLEQGFGAVSHRAVAARAGLPLAATTYYFASLDDLRVQAADLLARRHVEQAAASMGRLPERPLGAVATARRLVAVVLPADGDDGVLAYYERYLEAGRSPALRPVVVRWNAELRSLLDTLLARTGHAADPALVLALVDGLAVTALAEGADPRRAATRGVTVMLHRGAEPGPISAPRRPSSGSG
jgi:DNA-binding transcriptional regulator YbjK